MYVPKDWWMICERTGMKFRRSQMRQEWNGLWVYDGAWESRHPQDFVKSVEEDTSVPIALPTIAQSVGETTNYGNVLIWTTTVILASITGLSDEDPIGIVMDNSATHWSFIDGDPVSLTGQPLLDSNGEFEFDKNGEIITTQDSFSGGYITLNTPVSYLCSHGNAVYLPSINNESWI